QLDSVIVEYCIGALELAPHRLDDRHDSRGLVVEHDHPILENLLVRGSDRIVCRRLGPLAGDDGRRPSGKVVADVRRHGNTIIPEGAYHAAFPLLLPGGNFRYAFPLSRNQTYTIRKDPRYGRELTLGAYRPAANTECQVRPAVQHPDGIIRWPDRGP